MNKDKQLDNINENDIKNFIDNYVEESEIRQRYCKWYCWVGKINNRKICWANCRNFSKYNETEKQQIKKSLKEILSRYKFLSKNSLSNYLFIQEINQKIFGIIENPKYNNLNSILKELY